MLLSSEKRFDRVSVAYISVIATALQPNIARTAMPMSPLSNQDHPEMKPNIDPSLEDDDDEAETGTAFIRH